MNQEQRTKNFRVAVASSGLGHIARGIETWARDTADALHERGVDVTLFSGAPLLAQDNGAPRVAVSCIRRRSALSRLIVRLMPGFAWRWGLKDGYGLEQLTFWWHLRGLLQAGGFDILHVQDPMLARWCRHARMAGRIATREILGHGTEETPGFLEYFPYVQHLAPYHMAEALASLQAAHGGAAGLPHRDDPLRRWFAIPNFVDTKVFRPVRDMGEKRALRASLGIPEDAFVVLSVASIKKHHKRIDYLVREAASVVDPRLFLLVAGAREPDTEELVQLAGRTLGGRAKLLCDLTRERMPDVFRAADVFVLCSLKEMMPIALIEAMSSGLPALVNAYPVLEWMIGPGGLALDMRGPGNLAVALNALMDDAARAASMGAAARQHAVRMFSKDVVVEQMLEMYGAVAGGAGSKAESRKLKAERRKED